MSQQQVLATTKALFEDAALGLQAKVTALAAGNPAILTDFAFVKWALAGTMQAATKVNVMIRPGAWRPNPKNEGRPDRDAIAQIEIGLELFAADADVIQDNVALMATAVAQVLDGLVPYSVANGGTIYDLEDPIEFLFGQFAGPTSHGFLARVTVYERSSQ